MPKLAPVSGKEAVRKLQAYGYRIARQRGSHVQMICEGDTIKRPITIPLHPELKKGLLRKILRDANMSVEEFSDL